MGKYENGGIQGVKLSKLHVIMIHICVDDFPQFLSNVW